MAFSTFLESKRQTVKSLVDKLHERFSYVSVLGLDVKTTAIRVDKKSSTIAPGRDTECGFVVKLSNGCGFFEYSLDDISGDVTFFW